MAITSRRAGLSVTAEAMGTLDLGFELRGLVQGPKLRPTSLCVHCTKANLGALPRQCYKIDAMKFG
jgi:hypothetical protein